MLPLSLVIEILSSARSTTTLLPSTRMATKLSKCRENNSNNNRGHERNRHRYRGDSSIHSTTKNRQIIFACKKLTGMIIHVSSIHPLPGRNKRINTFEAPSKMSIRDWPRSRGTILRRRIGQDGERKRKGEFKFSRVDQKFVVRFFRSKTLLTLAGIDPETRLEHESFKIEQFNFDID